MSWDRGLRRELRPSFRQLVALATQMDPGARVTSALRSRSEQAKLYRRYLAGQSRYPVAPPGRSKHEQGRAIDIVATDQTLRRLGALWTQAGGRWGGERDPIHFEA